MFSVTLKEIKGRLSKEVEANPALGNFKEIQMLKRTLSAVLSESADIKPNAKFINELKLKNETINFVIADICQGDIDKMEKVEYFCKFLAYKTHSFKPIKSMAKEDFTKLRGWLKINSGIKAEERKPKADK